MPLSTVYRWRERDPKFRDHWDTLLAQRRQIAEDRLMATIREGELHTVYYKGLEVGLRRTFSHRVAIRAFDYLDCRESGENRRPVSRSAARRFLEIRKGRLVEVESADAFFDAQR